MTRTGKLNKTLFDETAGITSASFLDVAVVLMYKNGAAVNIFKFEG